MILHRQVWYRWKALCLAVLTAEFQRCEQKLAEKSELKDGVLEPLQGSLLRRFGSELAVRCSVCVHARSYWTIADVEEVWLRRGHEFLSRTCAMTICEHCLRCEPTQNALSVIGSLGIQEKAACYGHLFTYSKRHHVASLKEVLSC